MDVQGFKDWVNHDIARKMTDEQLQQFAAIGTALETAHGDDEFPINIGLSTALSFALFNHNINDKIRDWKRAKERLEDLEAELTGALLWQAKGGNKSLHEVTNETGVYDYFFGESGLKNLTIDEWKEENTDADPLPESTPAQHISEIF